MHLPWSITKDLNLTIVSMNQLLATLMKGDRHSLSKAITLVESNLASDRRKATALLRKLSASRQSVRVGITGAPGVGKSTFTDSIGTFLLDNKKVGKVAVLAVDPSSEVSGGSILGDKTRMSKLAMHPNAFIRPSPSRGTFGGIALTTNKVVRLCEAAGFDLVWIETVGTGQAETAVAKISDIMLLLVAPNSGDDIQGMKKGIVELADLVVVNKADCEAAEQTVAFYKQAIGLSNSHRPVQVNHNE